MVNSSKQDSDLPYNSGDFQRGLKVLLKHLVSQTQANSPCLKCLITLSKNFSVDSTQIIQELFESGGDTQSHSQGTDSPLMPPCSAVCEKPANKYNTVEQHRHYDFAKRKYKEGEIETNIILNQPWLLMEQGIRAKRLHYLDGFLFFNWPKTITNPKSCFAVIISKGNKLIPRVKFKHDDRKADVWELTGLEKEDNQFNIVEAHKLLMEALQKTKNTRGPSNIPVEIIVASYELDPESLPLIFCIAEIITEISNAVFPPEMLGGMYKLLQQWEKRYREGIAAIEGCRALENADIKDQLQKYQALLDKTEKALKQFRTIIKNKDVQDSDDSQISEIRLNIERIRSNCKSIDDVFECCDFQTLLNMEEIQNACVAVAKQLLKYATGLDYKYDYFVGAFKQHFAQLILGKVELDKLKTPFSLASYCRKTIFYQLRDQIIEEKYGFPYRIYSTILKKRKTEQTLYQQSGRMPTDEEISQKMNITIEQFSEIKAFESSLTPYEFDEERDSHIDNNNETQEI